MSQIIYLLCAMVEAGCAMGLYAQGWHQCAAACVTLAFIFSLKAAK